MEVVDIVSSGLEYVDMLIALSLKLALCAMFVLNGRVFVLSIAVVTRLAQTGRYGGLILPFVRVRRPVQP